LILDERSVHRIEAFSDIVIGFGLAQLGTSLALNPRSMMLERSGLLVFVSSFAIVCSLWFLHHRLFLHYFVPRTLPIVLNFFWLAIVVLLVFTAVQSRAAFTHRNFALFYFGLYGLAYALLAFQTLLGVRAKPGLSRELRETGIRQAWMLFLWASVFELCLLLGVAIASTITFWLSVDAVFILAGIATAALVRVFRRRRARLMEQTLSSPSA